MWQTYIVECADKSLYAGIAKDAKRRTVEHNSSLLGAKYTRARRPVRLVYWCVCQNRSEAAKKEYQIKKMKRSEKIGLIMAKNNNI